MTDILKVALDRRAQLHEEVAKLNEFIRYAETLMRGAQGGEAGAAPAPRPVEAARPAAKPEVQAAPRPAPKPEPAAAAAVAAGDTARPSIIRRGA